MIQKLCEQIISKYYGADLKISSMKPVHGGDCSDAFKAVLTRCSELIWIPLILFLSWKY